MFSIYFRSCNVKNVRKGKGCFLRIKTPTCKALRNLHKQDIADGAFIVGFHGNN